MKKGLLIFAVVAACGQAALAAPQRCPDTGHYYEMIFGIRNWYEARDDAAGRAYQGEVGHLVTITSSAEMDFVLDSIMEGSGSTAFAGGYQPAGATSPTDPWFWVTGETWDYTAWASDEPDHASGAAGNAISVNLHDRGWQDFTAEGVTDAYVVEYAPEPGTACLLALCIPVASRRKIRSRNRSRRVTRC